MRNHESSPANSLDKRSPVRSTAGLVITVAVLLWAAAAAPAQDTAVEGDYGMIKHGESLFRIYCKSCHGAGAAGDGALAESLRVPPANLTLLAQENQGEFPFERVRERIDGRQPVRGHGSSDMPVWGKVLKNVDQDTSEEQVADKVLALAHYIRSLQVTQAVP